MKLKKLTVDISLKNTETFKDLVDLLKEVTVDKHIDRGIRGYYKVRVQEIMNKMEVASDE